MKVGTDGTLLGAWADVSNTKTALDIGTGTGLISLMLAQRNQNLYIDALELDSKAAEQADHNVQESCFRDQIAVHHDDFRTWQPKKKYDLIVSNPPFFEQNVGVANSKERASARQQVNLTIQALIEKSLSILNDDGKLAIIVPSSLETSIEEICKKAEKSIRKVTYVKGNPGAKAKRILIEIGDFIEKTEKDIISLRNPDQGVSKAYRDLGKEFYINW